MQTYEKNRLLQRKMNTECLALLRENGADLGTTIGVTNVFYANDEVIAETLSINLAKHDFRVIEKRPSFATEYLGKLYIGACNDVILEPSSLDSMTDLCVDIAQHCGAEYDGWFTEVQPPDAK